MENTHQVCHDIGISAFHECLPSTAWGHRIARLLFDGFFVPSVGWRPRGRPSFIGRLLTVSRFIDAINRQSISTDATFVRRGLITPRLLNKLASRCRFEVTGHWIREPHLSAECPVIGHAFIVADEPPPSGHSHRLRRNIDARYSSLMSQFQVVTRWIVVDVEASTSIEVAPLTGFNNFIAFTGLSSRQFTPLTPYRVRLAMVVEIGRPIVGFQCSPLSAFTPAQKFSRMSRRGRPDWSPGSHRPVNIGLGKTQYVEYLNALHIVTFASINHRNIEAQRRIALHLSSSPNGSWFHGRLPPEVISFGLVIGISSPESGIFIAD